MSDPKPGAENTELLIKAFSVLNSEEEYYRFLEDLCTASELEILAQRLKVAGMLVGRETYCQIAEKTGTSTATISRIKRFLNCGSGGYELVLERLREKGDL